MALPGSNPIRQLPGASSVQFPAGLRVLVVDDDPTCLRILEKMLQACQYEVKKCDDAESALNELRRNRNGFDIVLSDVYMPNMDGFKLLEHIRLEMNVPVIIMSADGSKHAVMKAITLGAYDFLLKPVRIEALKNIWQHVLRKKENESKDIKQSGSVDEGDGAQKQEDMEYSLPAYDDDQDTEDVDDKFSSKKPQLIWTVKLHRHFIAAVNQLGIDKAVPEKILEMMNVPGLTRENVANHLQKYRLYIRRLSSVSQHQGDNEDTKDKDDSFSSKKLRLIWTPELHRQFVAAINLLGIDKAAPEKIRDLMNVPGLTTESVARHLQKYRLCLRRLSGISQHQGDDEDTKDKDDNFSSKKPRVIWTFELHRQFVTAVKQLGIDSFHHCRPLHIRLLPRKFEI